MLKKIMIGLMSMTLMSGVYASTTSKTKNKNKEQMAITSYKVVPASSMVKWVGTKVSGSHDGKVNVKEGKLKFKGNELVGGKFVIDMTSITVDDIKNPEYNQKLVVHLKNDDFFSTDKFKTATLKVKKVSKESSGTYNVSGDLTIKGITKPISFPAKVSMDNGSIQANGKITIDRTNYGVKYGSGKFFENLGDRMIHDTFTLDVSLVAKK